MRKKINQLMLFCGLFFAINLLIGHVLEQAHDRLIKKGKFFPYMMWNDFYLQKNDSLDLLFLGSSHCYRGFDPEIFDKSLGIHSFNLGTPSQSPLTSYFVLKEALKTQHPKTVIIDLFWLTFDKSDPFSNASFNYEFMRSPDVKYEFFLKGFDTQGKLLLYFPSYRYRDRLEDSFRLAMGKDLEKVDDGTYKFKGFVESFKIVSLKELNEKNRFDGSKFKKEAMDPKEILYIRKIVELCRSKDISIIFITTPMPAITIGKVKSYHDVHEYIHCIAAGLNVPYIDFNTDVPKDFFINEDFSDKDHLNNTGVKKFDDYIISRLKLI